MQALDRFTNKVPFFPNKCLKERLLHRWKTWVPAQATGKWLLVCPLSQREADSSPAVPRAVGC